MDYLWTPWRYAYITGSKSDQECVFCHKQSEQNERESWIVHRARHCYICLNAFPYTSGHVMIIPFQHTDELQKLPQDAAHEMMDLCRRTELALRNLYRPDGINLGMNIGAAAGAGVAGHVHMHMLPRWVADSNFMTVVGETRILPEALEVTWERMRKEFARK
jgi:ATP adenylyltransferase